jgi:hypothetical protein
MDFVPIKSSCYGERVGRGAWIKKKDLQLDAVSP